MTSIQGEPHEAIQKADINCLRIQGTGTFSSAKTGEMTLTGRILPCPPSGGFCATSGLIQP